MDSFRSRIIGILDSLRQSGDDVNHFKISFSFEELYDILIARSNFKSVFLVPQQKRIFKEVSEEASVILPLHDFIIKGFIIRAIKNWQLTHNQPIIILTKKNLQERFKIGAKILREAIDRIGNAFYMSDKTMKRNLLNEAFHVMIERYEEQLSLERFIDNPDNQDCLMNYKDTRI